MFDANVGDMADATYQGVASEDIAQKLVDYAKEHASAGGLLDALRQKMAASHSEGFLSNTNSALSSLAVGPGSTSSVNAQYATSDATQSATTLSSQAFSIAALLSDKYAFQVVYCIIWIVLGVALLFFGLASFYWATGPRFAPKHGKTSRRLVGGGVAGAFVGFLAGSYLSVIVVNAIATRKTSSLGSAAMFAVFLASGFVLMAASAHVRVMSRVLTGLLAGTCATIIASATFGIHTILVRSVLLGIFCVLLTGPLLVSPKSRYPRTKRWLLIIDTSIIGAVAFLDGVALFAPPRSSSWSWINLWTLLFAPDDSASQKNAMLPWGEAAFKGYIAGAVLSVVASVAFEAWFHRNATESVDDEWNEYLGVYTGRLEKDGLDDHTRFGGDRGTGGSQGRAGMFEPPRSIWSRLKDTMEGASTSPRRSRVPASYGNTGGDARAPLSGGFTELPYSNRQSSRRNGRKLSRSSTKGPARFEALSKRDGDLEALNEEDSDGGASDSDATDVGEEFDGKKEAKDSLAALPPPKMANYGGYSLPVLPPLPRPPSYRTDSPQSASQLSGSTVVSSSHSISNSTGSSAGSGIGVPTSPQGGKTGGSAPGEVHRPVDVYRDASPNSVTSSASSPPQSKSSPHPHQQVRAASFSASQSAAPISSSSAAQRSSSQPSGSGAVAGANPSHAGPGMVPATPSLINAIDRIQRAQQQAKEWQAQHQQQHMSPYGKQDEEDDAGRKASVADEKTAGRPAKQPNVSDNAVSSTTAFDQWWQREVQQKK